MVARRARSAAFIRRSNGCYRDIERAWRRHPRRIIVDNDSADFGSKLGEVLGHVSNLVQPPGPAGIL